MSDDKMPVKIWQPFKSENYRYSWHDKNILGIISQFFTDIKYCWQRCIRGYCDFDIYSIDFWFRDIMPHMLVQLRDTRHGSPMLEGFDEKTTHEEWTKILDRMIFLFNEASEETCTKKNPYEAEHEKIFLEFEEKYGLFGEKLQTEEELEQRKKGSGSRIHFASELPEYRDTEEKYFAEYMRLEEYRTQCCNEALALFTKHFYTLWD